MHVYLQAQLRVKMCIYRLSVVISGCVVGEIFNNCSIFFFVLWKPVNEYFLKQCIPIKQLFVRVHIVCLNKTIIRNRNKPYPFLS